MRTHNEIEARAAVERCFEAAADVERWPEILPHYRRVRYHRRDGFGRGRVEMAAFRHFGPLPYPVWWVSEMEADPDDKRVRYRHVDGITAGMRVVWALSPAGESSAGRSETDGHGGAGASPPRTRIQIIHEWDGPGWPLVGGLAARRVIGPHFVHVVAQRTLSGIRREVERG